MKDQTDEKWVTESGKEIPVEDMSETHVRNVLRMIIRNIRTGEWNVDKNPDYLPGYNNGEFYR